MIWVGITGCMGCGKSAVAQFLREDHDFSVISADHEVQEILKGDEEVHRFVDHTLEVAFLQDFEKYKKKIANQIFPYPSKLAAFEKLIHSKVRIEVQKKKEKLSQSENLIFYEVPLLFEKNIEADFNFIVAVIADKQIQIQRLKDRRQWSNKEIEERLKHHVSCESKIKKSDFVIFNNESLDNLKDKTQVMVEECFRRFDL